MPAFVPAVEIAARSEPAPESFAFVTIIGRAGNKVPPTVRFDRPVMAPLVSKVIFVGHVTGADTVILPAVALPIVSVLATMLLIVALDIPSVVFVLLAPRLISVPLPIGWMMTFPAEVAFALVKPPIWLAVRMIKPPLDFTLNPPPILMPESVLRLRGVIPVIVTLPAPVVLMYEEPDDRVKLTPIEPVPVPHEVPLTVIEPVLVVTMES